MSKYIVSLLQKTSNDKNMTDKKPELSDAMRKKMEPKIFKKNPIFYRRSRKSDKKCGCGV